MTLNNIYLHTLISVTVLVLFLNFSIKNIKIFLYIILVFKTYTVKEYPNLNFLHKIYNSRCLQERDDEIKFYFMRSLCGNILDNFQKLFSERGERGMNWIWRIRLKKKKMLSGQIFHRVSSCYKIYSLLLATLWFYG